MVIKQCFTIKDEIMHDKYEVSGQTGCHKTGNKQIMLLDFAQMGQYVFENCLKQVDDDTFSISEKDITAMARQWSREISDIILDNIYENAISDAEDDETVIVKE